jgi:hypothetical protein
VYGPERGIELRCARCPIPTRGWGIVIQTTQNPSYTKHDKCRDEVRKQIVGRLHEVACEAKAAGLTPSGAKESIEAILKGGGSLYSDTPSALLGLEKGKR